jgi:hypothetical protein
LANRGGTSYFCSVVHEEVKIALKNRPALGPVYRKNEPFVQCDQLECQYVGVNLPPCPLRLELFAEEIENRKRKSEAE